MAEYREYTHQTRNGLALHFRSYGPEESARTPVLCLSGLTRNSRDFHALATHLAAERQVICLDYRGCGRSDRDLDYMNYQVNNDAADVVDLLDGTSVKAAIFVGTSRGGLVTMTLALSRPDLIAAVVLNDVGPAVRSGGRGKVGKYFDLPYAYPDWDAACAAFRAWSEKTTPGLSDAQWMDRARATFVETRDARVRFDFDPKMGDAYRGRTNPPHSWAKFEALKDKPILSIRGAWSGILTAETVEEMRQAKPDLQAATIPNRGHTPLLDEPESLAAIDAFFKDLP
ncbi:MAG: alpha/beta hydrolase [Proteobacteria bacterium]|nr:alpha/beta hydrolase [Pseudomonadota bacterium]MDA1058918.1 alpha/beta hydrolase [Pseudomonadota bacterium]